MSNKRLFDLFDSVFPAVFGIMLVVALLLLAGMVITSVHFISRWW